MPQSTQIVPKYNYPYVETVVNDNSSIDDTVVNNVTDETYSYLCVHTSGKGPDNKLVCIDSLKTHRDRFGKSNYRLYGQPLMMAETILSQINTKVWEMRVMPEDAVYANSILSLWYKEDLDNKVFRIKFTTKSLSKFKEGGSVDTDMEQILSNRELIISKAAELDGAAVDGQYVDAEGYTQVPFAVFTSSGRGTYGNNYSWRVAIDSDYEKEYGFKIFHFECLESENGTTSVGEYKGSLVSSNKVSQAVFINDVIEDKGLENISMDIHVYEENVEKLYDAFVAFVKKVMEEDPTIDYDIPDIDCFDPFFGLQVAKNKVRVTPADPMIKIIQLKTDEIDEKDPGFKAEDYTTIESDVVTEESTVIVSDVTGISLHCGHDGSFTVDNVNDPTGSKRKKAIDEAYIKAFSGSLDSTILSARRVPANALFDANYSMEVKKVLAKFALFRNDALLYLDTGIMDTLTNSDISSMEQDFTMINDLESDFDVFTEYLISVNLHHYYVRESSTGKRVPVTITYFLASIHPNHWRTYGYHVPMVGSDFATLSGHIKNTLKPSIEEYEGELMERLNLSRFNYFEVEGEDLFVRRTQNTFIAETSDLLEESNVNTLMYLKRNITADARDELYDFTDATQRADFAEFIKAKYDPLVGKQIEKLDIEYTQNQWEFERSIVHMYVAVVFRQIAKRIIVEIDINKRTYEEE